MEIFRRVEGTIKVGDIVEIEMCKGTLTTVALRQEDDCMVLLAMNEIPRKLCGYSMDQKAEAGYVEYQHSDLRDVVNSEVLEMFPDRVKSALVQFENGDFISVPRIKDLCDYGTHNLNEELIGNFPSGYWLRDHADPTEQALEDTSAWAVDCFGEIDTEFVSVDKRFGIRIMLKIKNK